MENGAVGRPARSTARSTARVGTGFARGWFDPVVAGPVPLAGPVRTSADRACLCPPRSMRHGLRSAAESGPEPSDPHQQIRAPEHDRRKNRREQAYFPAQQPPTRQDARLPPADAHPCRSRHPGGPSSQGSLRALRLRPSVLPARHRLRERSDFAAVLKGPGGARAATRLLVVHANQTDTRAGQPPRVGLVVSKAVGTAVVRNRTKRRLRAQLAPRLAGVPDGTDLVVRANPVAGQARSTEIAAALEASLPTALARLSARRAP